MRAARIGSNNKVLYETTEVAGKKERIFLFSIPEKTWLTFPIMLMVSAMGIVKGTLLSLFRRG